MLEASPTLAAGTRERSILFAAGCLHNESSGPYLSLRQTVQGLTRRGHRTMVLGTRSRQEGDPTGWAGEVKAFTRYGPYSLHYAPTLARWMGSQPDRWDLASLQGAWLYPNHPVAAWCIRHDRPFMITTHGTFNPVALRISAWKKRLARLTFMRRAFARSTCFQASTQAEYRALREHGVTQPVCIIPNGIDLPPPVPRERIGELLPPGNAGRRTCLYLGRLTPIKGIDRLLRAWARISPADDWQLVIAGGGDAAYRANLEKTAEDAGCRNVRFTGFVTAETKAAWLRQAEFLVLPSHSEAFAMTPLEAFAHRTPALLTTACGFPEAAAVGAAVEVASSEVGIEAGLEEMLALAPPRLAEMGERAQKLVGDRYSWDVICAQLEEVYDWMCGTGPAPACLRLD